MSSSQSSAGGPSRRPVPIRTLPQPSRLSVAQRDASGTVDKTPLSDADALRKDLARRSVLAKKADKWADKLMEETPTREQFKKALAYFSPRQFREVQHERHLNGLCSYPPCPNAPSEPYRPGRRFKISTTHRTIKEKEGNEEEGFCSRACRVRCAWVNDQLGESPIWAREPHAFLLLEEEEEASGRGDQKQSGTSLPKANAKRAFPIRPPPAGVVPGKPVQVRAPPPALPRVEPPSNPGVADLLASLQIHERPTTTTPPVAPSLDAPRVHKPALPAPDSNAARRAGSSLIGTPGKLQSTLLSASRQMGPIRQMAPDSDDDADKGDWGESEMGLGWGREDDETRQLFEQARAARNLVEEEE